MHGDSATWCPSGTQYAERSRSYDLAVILRLFIISLPPPLRMMLRDSLRKESKTVINGLKSVTLIPIRNMTNTHLASVIEIQQRPGEVMSISMHNELVTTLPDHIAIA